MNRPITNRLTAIFVLLTLVTAACISPNEQEAPPPEEAQDASEQLSEIQEEEPEEAADPTGNESASDNKSTAIANSRQNAITEAVEKVSPAVVSITVTEIVQGQPRLRINRFFEPFLEPGADQEYSSMGSGFIISEDGLVVTNEHVARQNASRIIVSLPDGNEYEAQVVGSDELADLAVLQIDADEPLPAVEFGDSDESIVGEWSLAIGNPFGLFDAADPSVTVGVISATNRDFRPNPNEPRVYIDMIQTDAAINSGNSGGPLVNSEGKVIGVNTFIYTGGTSAGNVGLGFAIPSNRVQMIVEQLTVEGEVRLPFDPGMEIREMTPRLVQEYNLPPIPGILVTGVNRDGPAFESGILPRDIILKVGDERVQSEMHLQAIYREYAVGDSVRLELYRDNKRYETKMKLRAKVEGE